MLYTNHIKLQDGPAILGKVAMRWWVEHVAFRFFRVCPGHRLYGGAAALTMATSLLQ